MVPVGSGSCPTDIVNKSFTVNCDKYGLTVSGNWFGKKEIALSVNASLCSALAKPTEVAVKLLLR